MTQRNIHSPIAIATPQGAAITSRTALVALVLITVLVLITGPISAGYGFV